MTPSFNFEAGSLSITKYFNKTIFIDSVDIDSNFCMVIFIGANFEYK